MKVRIENARLEQVYPSSDDKYRVVVDARVDGRRKQYTFRQSAEDTMDIIHRRKDKWVMAQIRKKENEKNER